MNGSTIGFNNLDTCAAFEKLQKYHPAVSLKTALGAERIRKYEALAGAGLHYNYAAKAVDDEIISVLQELADEQQLIAKYRLLLGGAFINTGEKRMVLHQLTRGQQAGEVIHQGKDLRAFYREQQERIYAFAAKVHRGEICGSTGKAFTTVVQIGIGGSDLGPRALYLALKNYAAATNSQKMDACFISNVDPDDASAVLSGTDPETTLFILVSKSGTTQETLTNRDLVIEYLRRRNISGLKPEKHIIAVTSEKSPLATSSGYLDSFFIDDFIGGRYSSTSAVGGAVLSLAFGREIFAAFLKGAAEADHAALNSDIRANASLLDAMIGLYERNALGYPSTAILPYSQALSRFPAHLQQLDMESNGKSVNRDGKTVTYATGPVIFGEPGTNGQHSFYQLLHQGTDTVPLQFIGFMKSQSGFDMEVDGATSQQKLNANLCAQIVAFAKGRDNANPNKCFGGERPSSLIYAEKLGPAELGALLAHFENKVMFQGFAWNINSFDQEGVQLGKILTSQVLAKSADDEALLACAALFGI
ncbi:MAG: glucose-6-phosphate isomerase [Spirochaetales bacterium]|nr:glucose-6-phosphate isomerase [Spirochaetales bacterium]